MEDLAKADVKTIRTFIDNNITAERLLADVLHPKKEVQEEQRKRAKETTTFSEKSRKQSSYKISDYMRTIND